LVARNFFRPTETLARVSLPKLASPCQPCASQELRSTDQLKSELLGTPENFMAPAWLDPTPTYWGSKGEPPQLIVLFEVFWEYVWKCKKVKLQTKRDR
jgi:hypothetical protein